MGGPGLGRDLELSAKGADTLVILGLLDEAVDGGGHGPLRNGAQHGGVVVAELAEAIGGSAVRLCMQ